MALKPLEADWNTFRSRPPEWRERYLDERNEAIAGVLRGGHSRSRWRFKLHVMHRYDLIRDDDLAAFSPTPREEALSSWMGAES